MRPDADDCVLGKRGEVCATYLPEGGTAELDSTNASGSVEAKWYDARDGGKLKDGSVRSVEGGGTRNLGEAPSDKTKDWAVLVRRADRPARTN